MTLPDGFAALRVKDVVRETDDAMSLVLDVPAEHAARFAYRAGQFLTLRVTVDGQEYRRCYSMSSSPVLQQDLRVTVKRDGRGVVSNWLNDHAAPGDRLEVGAPEGRFVRSENDRELVAFAGGSGITPVFSLIQTALASPTGRARLLYANRAAGAIIFESALADLVSGYGDRFTVSHHLDDDRGVLTASGIAEFLTGVDIAGADFYICGPGPFMDTVEAALRDAGVPADQVHLERFSVAPVPVEDNPLTEQVTIELDRQVVTTTYRPGHTLLQMARMAGLKAPSSCETGSCGTCIAQVTEGSARLLNNDALDEDEIAEGLVVTCQALPTSRSIRFVYE
ncbi:ferredoxin--NADP reductase [Mycobacterium sp. AMU20-3851]|uniref:2Fe-2S iron-sulfur cluster-binding protein n=1 Tax=Mycobacterium sp. AMU20-3851 TaxID=3122055 RepID=UPI003754597E